MNTHAGSEVLDRAELLTTEGRYRDALELLTAGAEHDPGAEVLARAVAVRHLAAARAATPAPPPFTAPTACTGPRGEFRPVAPHEVSVAVLRDGLSRHGCLWIRGLVDLERADRLRRGIDRALDAFDAAVATEPGHEPDTDGWYTRFTPDPGRYRLGGRRQWVRKSGALWTADSPRMFHELSRLLTNTGIGAVVEEYFGERPALSANKCTLRRVPLDTNVGWHQDGAFLGADVRSINLWLALDHCGSAAPGMDIVPRRFDHVVEAGTGDAMFDWSVSTDVVAREAGDAGVIRPDFEPGDALLFDHLFLHSTAVTPGMDHERHAMETWLFAPSAYPEGQIPLAW